MKRGVIISNCTINLVEGGVQISSSISDVDLNYYLLYWDKILMPTNSIIHVACRDEDQLLKTGFLERPSVAFESWSSNPKNYYDPVLTAQSIIANKVLSEKSDIDFTLHQIGNKVVLADEQKREFNSIKVELLDCLPVPSKGVHFQDILEFKAKRADELTALRSSIDQLYFEVISSPDKDLQKKINVSKLQKAITDLEKTSIERFFHVEKFNFSAELNFDLDVIRNAVLGGLVLDYSSTMIFPIGTVLSGALSCIKINANKTVSVAKAEDKFKLNFLAQASKKKIISGR